MRNAPQISVVMPLFNKVNDVKRAVHSVLSQTFPDFELIVVNDGSTDKGDEVVKNIDDPRIKLIHQENSGVSIARNRGIDESRGSLIAFIDADDEWMIDFLETIMILKESYPICKVFATRYYQSINGIKYKQIIRGLPYGFKQGILKNYFMVSAQSGSVIHSSAIAVEKKAIISIGKFPPNIKIGEDLLTWARLASIYDIAYSTKPCAVIHCITNISQRPGRVPDNPDFVGKELVSLLKSTDSFRSRGLKEYIASWHRMRGVIFIQLNQCDKAIDEFKKALKYSLNLKIIALILLAIMPFNLPQLIHNGFHNARRTLRSFLKISGH